MYNGRTMDDSIRKYLDLYSLFHENGYSLFLVGGTVRDYLLNNKLDDMDAVTDATPEEMKKFLPNANYVFAKFGSVSIKIEGTKFDITTLREENSYIDSRHPGEVKFVKDLNIDVKRRDFTINALYLDHNLQTIDYVDGVSDLKKGILRMVGNPENRLKEDPLRIIRALRFSIDYDLSIEEELDKAIRNNISLLDKLNIEKIKQDIKKIKCLDKEKISKKFIEYDIKHLLDVLK